MSNTNRNREDRLRRTLAKSDYRLVKGPPANSYERKNYGVGYMVVDRNNTVVEGCIGRAYSSSLDEVAAFAADL